MIPEVWSVWVIPGAVAVSVVAGIGMFAYVIRRHFGAPQVPKLEWPADVEEQLRANIVSRFGGER